MEESNITFASLGLSDAMLKALEKKGYGYPTTIQAEAIPYFLQWRDVIAKAPTGTGKTFAFGIPMIEHIDAESEEVQGLILAPTRELAIQIGDELRGLLTYFHNIRVAVLYGGAGIGGQIKALEKKPQIVLYFMRNYGCNGWCNKGNRLYCTPNNRIPYRSLCIETCVACYSFQNTEIPYD